MSERRNRVVVLTPTNNLAQDYWTTIERFRGHVDVSDYKHFILNLLFLRALASGNAPALWHELFAMAGSGDIFSRIDSQFNIAFTESFRRVHLYPPMFRQLLNCTNELENYELSSVPDVFEYCLERFSALENKTGGDFTTPRSIVNLLVKTIAPSGGIIYDPCCGSGGLLAHASRHASNTGGNLQLFGQESNPATWRMCWMNLAARGLQYDLGARHEDTFRFDLHAGLKADFILANPPFNQESWRPERAARKWNFGEPPERNGNFAWIQHIIGHMSPGGFAAFTMGNGALSSNSGGEAEIRRAVVDAGLVDCIIALPPNLFHSTRIPVSIWILARNKGQSRRQKILFIDAQNMGQLSDRVHRVLCDAEIDRIVSAYHDWRENADASGSFVPGFCQSRTHQDVAANNYILNPGHYVGIEAGAYLNEDPAARIETLAALLDQQFKESVRLEKRIRESMEQIGYGI